MTIQTKFMDKMESLAVQRKLHFIVQANYANTGVALFQRPDSFAPLVQFTYAFQVEYSSFEGIPNPKRIEKGWSNQDKWYHVTPEQLDEFIWAVEVTLDAVLHRETVGAQS